MCYGNFGRSFDGTWEFVSLSECPLTASPTACSASFSLLCPESVTMRGMESSMESLIMECPVTMPVSEPVVMLFQLQ